MTRNAEGHAQAGAGPHHEHGSACLGLTADHRRLLAGLQMGKSIDQNGEVVHQFHPFDSRRHGEMRLRELPGQVGEPGGTAAHGPSHGEAGRSRPGLTAQKRLHHRSQVRPITRCIAFAAPQGERRALALIQSQQCFGAADVSRQQRG